MGRTAAAADIAFGLSSITKLRNMPRSPASLVFVTPSFSSTFGPRALPSIPIAIPAWMRPRCISVSGFHAFLLSLFRRRTLLFLRTPCQRHVHKDNHILCRLLFGRSSVAFRARRCGWNRAPWRSTRCRHLSESLQYCSALCHKPWSTPVLPRRPSTNTGDKLLFRFALPLR